MHGSQGYSERAGAVQRSRCCGQSVAVTRPSSRSRRPTFLECDGPSRILGSWETVSDVGARPGSGRIRRRWCVSIRPRSALVTGHISVTPPHCWPPAEAMVRSVRRGTMIAPLGPDTDDAKSPHDRGAPAPPRRVRGDPIRRRIARRRPPHVRDRRGHSGPNSGRAHGARLDPDHARWAHRRRLRLAPPRTLPRSARPDRSSARSRQLLRRSSVDRDSFPSAQV